MNTVNVVTTGIDGYIMSINAFTEDTPGNKQAEAIFKKKLNTILDLDISDDDAEVMVEDGYAVNGAGMTCQLVHSIEPEEE